MADAQLYKRLGLSVGPSIGPLVGPSVGASVGPSVCPSDAQWVVTGIYQCLFKIVRHVEWAHFHGFLKKSANDSYLRDFQLKQGQIHGYSSHVRVGRGRILGHWTI